MKRSKSQFTRLMELDQKIRKGDYPNCLNFSVDYEVSQKTIQRDIDFLRDQMGAPIEYDRERKGFYYTDQSWFLPSLSMSEGDLLAVLMGAKAMEAYRGTPVAKDLSRVFSKISELLPDKLSVRPELIFTRFTFTSPPAKPINEKIWIELVRGLMNQRSLDITYRSLESKEPKKHVIDPHHIANLSGEWYVFARCQQAGEIRQFSIPRIHKAELLDKGFEMQADFDPEKLLETTFGRFVLGGTVHEVKLLFSKEIQGWVTERLWHPKQKITQRANGDIELSFKVTGLFEVFRWVMAWGHNCKVLAPAELKKWVKDEVKMMGRSV